MSEAVKCGKCRKRTKNPGGMCHLHEGGSPTDSVGSSKSKKASSVLNTPPHSSAGKTSITSPSSRYSIPTVNEAHSEMEDFIMNMDDEEDSVHPSEVLQVGLETIGSKEVYEGSTGYSIFQKSDGNYVCAQSWPPDELEDGDPITGDVTDMLPEHWADKTITSIHQNNSYSSLDEAVNSTRDRGIHELHSQSR